MLKRVPGQAGISLKKYMVYILDFGIKLLQIIFCRSENRKSFIRNCANVNGRYIILLIGFCDCGFVIGKLLNFA